MNFIELAEQCISMNIIFSKICMIARPGTLLFPLLFLRPGTLLQNNSICENLGIDQGKSFHKEPKSPRLDHN
jgi:hypothetical protein